MKLLSWNVNGVRSCLKKGLSKVLKDTNPEIVCLQEIKADAVTMAEIAKSEFPSYTLFNSSAVKKGYSGVSTLIRTDFLDQELEHRVCLENPKEDPTLKLFADEGRFSILNLKGITLYNVYIPSGTRGEERQGLKYVFLDHFFEELKRELKENSKIIICGDFNICHKEIDIHHPKVAEQRGLTGFLPEERAWMDKFVDLGFVDCFRLKHGQKKDCYSWWSYRAGSRPKNLGWRIDYFFCTKKITDYLLKADIHNRIEGSDHCPLTIELDWHLS